MSTVDGSIFGLWIVRIFFLLWIDIYQSLRISSCYVWKHLAAYFSSFLLIFKVDCNKSSMQSLHLFETGKVKFLTLEHL